MVGVRSGEQLIKQRVERLSHEMLAGTYTLNINKRLHLKRVSLIKLSELYNSVWKVVGFIIERRCIVRLIVQIEED